MQEDDQLLTKEQHILNFIKSFVALEEAIEPFKEQKRDLRESYNENSWLSKEEMRLAIRAYRLMKSDTDIEQLTDYFNQVKRGVGGIDV